MQSPDRFPNGYEYTESYAYAPAMDERADAALLLSRVSFLTLGMVLCTALGAGIFWMVPSVQLFYTAMIMSFLMIFVLPAISRNHPFNLVGLSAFAILKGMVLAPLLMVSAHLHGPMIIIQAAMLTAVIFGMVGTLGYTSARSYANWLPWLLGGLCVLILGGLVLAFMAFSPAGYWLYSSAGCVLMVVFTYVDFTRIRHDYTSEDYALATLDIYLDLIILFRFVLMLLGLGRRR